jgi:predicted DNA-binding protein (MmcQ/YjbR family)
MHGQTNKKIRWDGLTKWKGQYVAFVLLKSADPIAHLLTLKQAQILSSYKFNKKHYKSYSICSSRW